MVRHRPAVLNRHRRRGPLEPDPLFAIYPRFYAAANTQDPEHESRYDPEAESHNIHRFLEGVRWQIAALTHALGYSDFRALNRDDLVALIPEAAEITGLPYAPGVRAKAPELRVRLG